MPVYTDPATALRLARASRAEDLRRAAQHHLVRRTRGHETPRRPQAGRPSLAATVVRWVQHAARPAAA